MTITEAILKSPYEHLSSKEFWWARGWLDKDAELLEGECIQTVSG